MSKIINLNFNNNDNKDDNGHDTNEDCKETERDIDNEEDSDDEDGDGYLDFIAEMFESDQEFAKDISELDESEILAKINNRLGYINFLYSFNYDLQLIDGEPGDEPKTTILIKSSGTFRKNDTRTLNGKKIRCHTIKNLYYRISGIIQGILLIADT